MFGLDFVCRYINIVAVLMVQLIGRRQGKLLNL